MTTQLALTPESLEERNRKRTPLVFDAMARFWKYTDRPSDPNGCWLWTGELDNRGYARMQIAPTVPGTKKIPRQKAHRFAYERLIGPIPDGLSLDHLCRVRHCVNPAHLEPVTNEENTKRGILRHGEDHYLAKLTDADVREIRRLYDSGVTNKELARRWPKVSRINISLAARRLSWRHVK